MLGMSSYQNYRFFLKKKNIKRDWKWRMDSEFVKINKYAFIMVMSDIRLTLNLKFFYCKRQRQKMWKENRRWISNEFETLYIVNRHTKTATNTLYTKPIWNRSNHTVYNVCYLSLCRKRVSMGNEWKTPNKMWKKRNEKKKRREKLEHRNRVNGTYRHGTKNQFSYSICFAIFPILVVRVIQRHRITEEPAITPRTFTQRRIQYCTAENTL